MGAGSAEADPVALYLGKQFHRFVDCSAILPVLASFNEVAPADIQDRGGAGPLLRASRPSWPFLRITFADGGYQGPRVAASSPIRVEMVRKAEDQGKRRARPRAAAVRRALLDAKRREDAADDPPADCFRSDIDWDRLEFPQPAQGGDADAA